MMEHENKNRNSNGLLRRIVIAVLLVIMIGSALSLVKDWRDAAAQRRLEASGDIQIVQHFNIADAGNLPALKKELRRLEPEFEKLVRRALERMRSDKARTAHAQ